MKRSKRMESIVKLARNDEKQAVVRMNLVLKKLQKMQTVLQELIEYQHEYSAKMQNTFAKGVGVMELRQYHGFLENINKGIGQQQNAIGKAQQESTTLQQEWSNYKSRVKALELAMENCKREENAEESKNEQKVMDEFSARLSRRRGDR